MKVTLTRQGGLAGMQRPPTTIDDEKLSQPDRQELRRLLREATAAAVPALNSQARDVITYGISVAGGGEPVVLKQADGAMSKEFGTLLAWLRQRASEPGS